MFKNKGDKNNEKVHVTRSRSNLDELLTPSRLEIVNKQNRNINRAFSSQEDRDSIFKPRNQLKREENNAQISSLPNSSNTQGLNYTFSETVNTESKNVETNKLLFNTSINVEQNYLTIIDNNLERAQSETYNHLSQSTQP